MATMRLEELQRLIAKGESETLEFKKSTGQRTEAAKTACALLNGFGGLLLFGISDKGEIVGQQVTAKTLGDISAELNSNPAPTWEIRTESVITTFSPSAFFATGRMLEEAGSGYRQFRPESRPESLETEVLALLSKEPLSKLEIARHLGHKQISGGLKKVIQNLLAKQKIEYTIPKKPGSRLQKYKLFL